VVLQHVEDADRESLLDLTADLGLSALVPDRSLERYIVTGALPEGCPDAAELVRSVPRTVTRHPACIGVVTGPARGPDAAARANMIRDRARGQFPIMAGHIVIDSGAAGSAPEASPTEAWLAQYHAALQAGRTGMVVLDRYRRLPGDPKGLTSARGQLEPAEAAALDMLADRARRWGPHLQGLTTKAIPGVRTNSADLAVTGFSKGRRRYALIVNNARDKYTHAEVGVPATIGVEPVVRAVEVPGSSDRPAGRVVHARDAHITLDVSLRPGDAALFELF
jgi:hypothetical protein